MNPTVNISRTTGRRSMRRLLLGHAFQILGVFTLLIVVTCVLLPSGARSSLALLPVRSAFVLGAATWITMFAACFYTFFIVPSERPSFMATLCFFLILGVELQILFEIAFG